jgi:hypothetical protein
MRKGWAISFAASLLAIAFAATASVAQAETKTVVSSETNSLCVNPVKGFTPKKGKNINYTPLTKANKGGPFPDTGGACASGSPTHPVAMAAPGQPAAPYSGAIPGASWVSIVANGSDASNPPPRYYIYDATFELCANQTEGTSMSGTMFADNEAGAFLNGQPIGNQPLHGTTENFDGPPSGGWPFGTNTHFNPGLNTLQFVVLDESPGFTALDFSATVTTAHPCEAEEFPGLGRCVKATAGGQEPSGCEEGKEGAVGGDEWLAGAAKNKFTSKEGLSFFETPTGFGLACKSDTDVGEYIGESEDLETVTFKDCDVPGAECTNQPGGFETKPLRSLYGFIKRPEEVGVSLEPVTGTTYAEFECQGMGKGSISGSVIAPVTPVRTMTKTFTETFTGSAGVQTPERFEGEPKDTLTCVIPPSSTPEPCSFKSTDKITNEEKLEIRLTP